MRTQFIFRSQGNKYAFELKTVLCEGVEITRFREDGIEVFEFNDPDVVVELVVQKKSPCGSTESNVESGDKKLSSEKPQLTDAAAFRDYPAVANIAAQKTGTPEEDSTDEKIIVNPSKPAANNPAVENLAAQKTGTPEEESKAKRGLLYVVRKPTAKQIEDNQKSIPMENNQITASISSKIDHTSLTSVKKSHGTNKVVAHPHQWNERFNQLQEFKRKHGNCYVSKNHCKSLHQWVELQRKYFRKGKIDDGRLQRLNEIGSSWNACESRWSLRYSQLMLYKKQHGHCRVPQKYAENPQLGEWVIQQRKEFRNGKITEDRIARLNDLDFTWDGRSDRGKSLNASHEDDDDEDGLMDL